ncbi:MAG: hypothetical protein V1844_26690 [Pseudomonadota bacterium]
MIELIFQNHQNLFNEALDFPPGNISHDEADLMRIYYRVFQALFDCIIEKSFLFLAQHAGDELDDILVFFRNEPLDKVQCFLIQEGKTRHEPADVSNALSDGKYFIFIFVNGKSEPIEQIFMAMPP